MRIALMFAAAIALSSGAVFAAGKHAGGQDNAHAHNSLMPVGEPGEPGKVSRNVDVVMRETDDGEMIFGPRTLHVRQGETIRFRIHNRGEVEHEFVLGDHVSVMEHKALMERMPEMEHDEPNSVRLDPGKRGEIIWKFTNDGTFQFACLIPGHYDSGMKGDLTVAKK
ncbi:MAG: cupredoxin family protein [Rhizobiaceae bacterium]|nr:cupredoxin family protein [Rhizobiaceae bacterium]